MIVIQMYQHCLKPGHVMKLLIYDTMALTFKADESCNR